MTLYLSSQSPRRKALLAELGVPFEALATEVDETPLAGEDPVDYVSRLAKAKAQAGLALLATPEDAWVLGSDTTVVADGEILGKPVDYEDFLRMMALLGGRPHRVLTAVSLVSAGQSLDARVVTEVTLSALSEDQAAAYWNSGEPQDKAGGYAIQGLASVFVEDMHGSYSAVVGLPMRETAQLLCRAGFALWDGQLRL
ncbi:MAG: Maf family protein [Saccharospirillum sp.]